MKKENTSRVLSSLIYVAIGLVLIFYPDIVGDSICYMLAGAAGIMGIIYLVGYATTDVETRVVANTNGFAMGAILVLSAVFIVVKKRFVISVIPFLLGLMIAMKGIYAIQNAINLKRIGYGNFKNSMIVAGLVFVFGVIMMLNPFSTARTLFIFLGIGMAVSGVFDLIAVVQINHQIRKITKEME